MITSLPMPAVAEPAAVGRAIGHLPRWGAEPLALLEEGAALSGEQRLFGLRLGLTAAVGFSPAWNRRLMTDLDTFRSAGSLAQMVPYLSGGIIMTDPPEHAPRRGLLNPGFARPPVRELMVAAREARPAFAAQFDALEWADSAVLKMLNAAYFSGEFDEELLHRFLAPLRRPFPAPLVPKPLTRRAVEAELQRLAHARAVQPRQDLLTFLLGVEDGLTEARISLAAAHDTTTHALAYALWWAARLPDWHAPERHPFLLKEVFRLYPPGWMGSRRLSRPLEWEGMTLPAGTLALYSPYLTGRDPQLWTDSLRFDPSRWESGQKPPAWAYIPFGGGGRTCLGMHLAQALILDTLGAAPPLQVRWGISTPQPGLTLGPQGPLWVEVGVRPT